MSLRRARSTLFPYTTLFRSETGAGRRPGREGAPGLRERGISDGRRAPGWGARSCPGRKIGRHTSELQSHSDLVCRLRLEKKKAGVLAGGAADALQRLPAFGV